MLQTTALDNLATRLRKGRNGEIAAIKSGLVASSVMDYRARPSPH